MKPKAQNTIGEMIDGAEQKVMNDLREQLRRQREINAELLEALQAIIGHDAHLLNPFRVEAARAAITKATGSN